MRRTQSREPDPTFLMIVGLVAWLYGLILFIRALDEPSSVTNYLSLALCTMGVTIFSRTITQMEGDMRHVAAFGIGHIPSPATYASQRIRLHFSSLMGQLIALLALSGVYTAEYGFGSYMDEVVYQNSPVHFLENLPADHPYVEKYNRNQGIICAGQGPWEVPETSFRLKDIFARKGINVWVDIWGTDVLHDWDWWFKQVAYFLPKMLG